VVVHEGLLKMLLSPDDLNAAGDYAITVFTDGAGESTLAGFRVRPPGEKPIPVLSVAAVDGGRQLYLFGSDFDPGTQVHLNGSPRSANVVHSGLITLQLSPADQGGVVIVTNPGPGGGTSNALAFIARVSWLPIMRR